MLQYLLTSLIDREVTVFVKTLTAYDYTDSAGDDFFQLADQITTHKIDSTGTKGFDDDTADIHFRQLVEQQRVHARYQLNQHDLLTQIIL